jgi:hypothetical protein
MKDYGNELDRLTIDFIKRSKKNKSNLSSFNLVSLIQELFNLNLKLWDLEDDIREDIPDNIAGKIGKEIAKTNDLRIKTKNEINKLLGSLAVEEKIYDKK